MKCGPYVAMFSAKHGYKIRIIQNEVQVFGKYFGS